MDYKKVYNELIESRKVLVRKRNDDCYYENHHIIPKCFGGSNKKENLVFLTFREHFMAHLLLTKIYDGENKSKMIWALYRMCHKNDKQKNKIVSTREYEKARKIFVENISFISKNIWQKRRKNGTDNHTLESLRKISDKKTIKICCEVERQICSDYSNLTLIGLSKKYNYSVTVIRRCLLNNNVVMERNHNKSCLSEVTKSKISESHKRRKELFEIKNASLICSMYNDGKSMEFLQNELHLAHRTVKRILVNNGVQIRQ
jgi:hypothetical protein